MIDMQKLMEIAFSSKIKPSRQNLQCFQFLPLDEFHTIVTSLICYPPFLLPMMNQNITLRVLMMFALWNFSTNLSRIKILQGKKGLGGGSTPFNINSLHQSLKAMPLNQHSPHHFMHMLTKLEHDKPQQICFWTLKDLCKQMVIFLVLDYDPSSHTVPFTLKCH